MMFSLFEAIAADQVRDNRHTFYDVFEQVNVDRYKIIKDKLVFRK